MQLAFWVTAFILTFIFMVGSIFLIVFGAFFFIHKLKNFSLFASIPLLILIIIISLFLSALAAAFGMNALDWLEAMGSR